ncbi:MAG: hypothetical protein LBD27_07780, partial [Tannerella sp.]|nr:hypothetical protein [Tannerella sp.]
MYINGSTVPSVRNTIICGNTKTSSTTVSNVYYSVNAPTYQNSLVGGTNLTGTNLNGTGVTAADLFVDFASGNYLLKPGSPAIDKGDDSYIAGVTADLDGNVRIIGAAVDLGAYEWTGADAVEITEAMSVAEIKAAIESALAINNILTVTGSKTGADATLAFGIPAGKIVVWKAQYEAVGNAPAITLSDDGEFEVAGGGTVSSTSDIAIYSGGASARVVVSDGVVFGCGMGVSDVIVKGGSGGYTGQIGAGAVIAWDISSAGPSAIYNAGSTTNLNYARYGATVCWGINNGVGSVYYASGANAGFIKVGGVTVQPGGIGNPVVITESMTVAQIKAAIENAFIAYDAVTVTGSKTTGVAATLTLDIPTGKKVVWQAEYEMGYNGISITLPNNGEFEVAQSGAVSMTAAGGIPIRATGENANVTVSGGMVISQRTAISANGASSTVTVSGGLVFTYGSNVSNAIDIPNNGSGYPGPTGMGVVVAWDKTTAGASPVYGAGSTTNLTYLPNPGATVCWANESGQYGISYTNGANSGFLEIDGVTVLGSADVSNPVVLTESMTVAQIKAAIENALAVYSAVTVTGSKTGVNAILSLGIPAGKKVVWQAQYEASGSYNADLIALTNNGELEVAQGGSVKSQYHAIYVNTTGGKVTVSGGVLSSQKTEAIYTMGSSSTAAVSGGAVFGCGTDVSGVII